MTTKKQIARREAWQKKFFDALRETGNVSEAAKMAGHPRQNCYLWRDKDPDFKAKWDEAMDQAVDALEREARRRAQEGVEEPVYHLGKVVGHIRKYSDTLLIFLLKGHRPQKYRDNANVELSGQNGGPIETRIVVEYADSDRDGERG